MAALSPFLRSVEGGAVSFWCPGCDEAHVIWVARPGASNWGYNQNPNAPTFTPSVLVRSGHYVPRKPDDPERGCWCSYNAELIAEGKEPSKFKCALCHSFVTDGKIQFLGDCTHALVNQTVALPIWPENS